MIDQVDPQEPEIGDRVVITDGVHSGRTGTIEGYGELTGCWVVELDGSGARLLFGRSYLEILGDESDEDIDFDVFGLTAEELATYVKAFSTFTAMKIVEGQELYDHESYQESETVPLADLLSATLTDIEGAGTTLAILHLRVTRILGALKGNV